MLTVIYYSASTERPDFEARIRARLRAAAGGLPIVSVTQAPVDDLGDNVCVGRRHPCDANAFRQLLIGAERAATDWIAAAEADAIYPPAYFLGPPDPIPSQVYRYDDVWILGGRGPFRKKEWTEGAQIVWRATLVAALTRVLDGRPTWSGPGDPKPGEIFRKRHWHTWAVAGQPVVSCKTGNGLRAVCGTSKTEPPRDALPHWGAADAVRAWLWRGGPPPAL